MPQYLGKDLLSQGEAVWIFFALKNGVGRFIRFIKYPFWASEIGIPAQLDVETQPPADVFEEVKLFVAGKVSYEEKKTPKGRKTKIVRILDTTDGKTGQVLPGGSSSGAGDNNVVRDKPRPPVPEREVAVATPPKRGRGRPRKLPPDGPGLPNVSPVAELKKDSVVKKRKVVRKKLK